jgi:hypothetical protein
MTEQTYYVRFRCPVCGIETVKPRLYPKELTMLLDRLRAHDGPYCWMACLNGQMRRPEQRVTVEIANHPFEDAGAG